MNRRYRVNQQIKESPLRLIDETGKNLGVVPLEEAVRLAIEKKLDLVEVSEEGVKPPVCRLIDFKKFQYLQQKQKRQKGKPKSQELKLLRIRVVASTHDLETKAKNVDKFLELNHRVLVEMRLRGRERMHPDLAVLKIKNFLTMIKNKYKVVQEIKRVGSNFSVLISKV